MARVVRDERPRGAQLDETRIGVISSAGQLGELVQAIVREPVERRHGLASDRAKYDQGGNFVRRK